MAGRLAERLGAGPLTMAGMATVAGALAVLGALRPTTPVFLTLLGVVGIGLGLFTPPNNAAIMGSVPQAQSGLASGVLNMTRGMGTALGLAMAGLVFDVAGGRSSGGRSDRRETGNAKGSVRWPRAIRCRIDRGRGGRHL